MNFINLYDYFQRLYGISASRFRLPLPPYHVFFEITHKCNIHCKFCQFSALTSGHPQQNITNNLTTSEIITIIDKLPSRCLLTITGGEPLVRPDCIELFKHASRRHKIHLITNGILLDKKGLVESFISNRARHFLSNGMFWISVSLVGLKETHDSLTGVEGSFERTFSNLKMLNARLNAGYPVCNVQTVITRNNITELPNLANIIKAAGILKWNLMVENSGEHFNRQPEAQSVNINPPPTLPYIEKSIIEPSLMETVKIAKKNGIQIRFQLGSKENIIKYYTGQLTLEQYYCYAPWTTLLISASGEAMLCYSKSLGNLKEKSFQEIWSSQEIKDFRTKLRSEGPFSDCVGCCMLQFNRKDGC